MDHAPVVGQKHPSLSSEVYELKTQLQNISEAIIGQIVLITKEERKNEWGADQTLVLLPLLQVQPRLFLLSSKERAGWLSNFPVELSAELPFLFLILQSLWEVVVLPR